MVQGVLPLPLLMPDGSIAVVDIPRMTATAFDFFKKQLDAYKAAIVVPDPPFDADPNTGHQVTM